MVRQPGHHALVGRPAAERVVRDLARHRNFGGITSPRKLCSSSSWPTSAGGDADTPPRHRFLVRNLGGMERRSWDKTLRPALLGRVQVLRLYGKTQILQLQVSRSRVFEKAIRDTAHDIRDVSSNCIYAKNQGDAMKYNKQLRKLYARFNEMVVGTLPSLY